MFIFGLAKNIPKHFKGFIRSVAILRNVSPLFVCLLQTLGQFAALYVLLQAPAAWANLAEVGAYPSEKNIDEYLKKAAEAWPTMVQLKHLGYSYQGRPIKMLIVGGESRDLGKSAEVSAERTPVQPILINSAHHGDEKISVQVVLGLIDFLVKSRGNPAIKELLKSRRFYLLPLVNPDGYEANSRYNAQGMDINRDYQEGEAAEGSRGFRTPEAKVLAQLMGEVGFHGALALHSGAEAIYWPLGDSPSPPKHQQTFFQLSQKMARAMGFRRSMQSYYDYPTQGEFIDFAYRRFGILGLTLEVSEIHQPPSVAIDKIVYRSIKGVLSFVAGISNQAPLRERTRVFEKSLAQLDSAD